MKLRHAFDGLDKRFKRWFEIDVNREAKYYSRRNRAGDIKDILYDMDIIDSKSSALLTHISIMFVVLGFFLNTENNSFIQSLLIIEFIAYVITAMVLLRCVDIMGPPFRLPPEEDNEISNIYYFEVTLRREIYVRALRTAYILTALLIPIIILKYIF